MMHAGLSSPSSFARSCPSCRQPLQPTAAGQVEIDRCTRCGGAFFDPGEVTSAFGPGADPEVWGRGPGVLPPNTASPWCPAGHGPMWRLPTGTDPHAPSVHACGSCRGVWVDGATLALVRRAGSPPAESASQGRAIARYVFQLVSLLPVEVSNPVSRKPIVTWCLATSMAVAFVALQSATPEARGDWNAMLALIPSEVVRGYGLLTPLTYAWIHAGWAHLLGNLYFLLIFGDNIEDRFGRIGYLALFAAASALGGLVEILGRAGSTITVGGASGAIAGVLGAYMVLFPRTRLRVVLLAIPLKLPAAAYFALWVALQVYGFVERKPGVAWLAHLGGFVVGLVAAGVVRSSESLARRAA